MMLNLSTLFFAFALVALLFLLYSLFNMRKLRIHILHPRIIVELSLFIIFLVLGFVLLN